MRIYILSAFQDSMQKDTAGSVRIYNLARNLAATGNDVNVILPAEQRASEIVDGVKVHFLRGLTPRLILQVLSKVLSIARPTSMYFYDIAFVLDVCRLIQDADVVQIEQQSSGGLLVPFIKTLLKKPILIDCHDVFQALRIRHTNVFRRALETFLERLVSGNADVLLTVSSAEQRFLVSAGIKSRKIEIIPNGVDTKLFVNSRDCTETRKKYGLEGYRTVTFVGDLEYLPNREAIEVLSSTIAPKVLQEHKDTKFLVVGRRRDNIRLPGLLFTGFVDDVPDLLCASDVAVAPIFHGSGTRLKILEYLSCGLPVVSTSVGAEGIEIKDGVDIFIEDNLDCFALRIIELLQNSGLSASMGKAARLLAASTYDWATIAKKLEKEMRCLLSERPAADDSIIQTNRGRITSIIGL